MAIHSCVLWGLMALVLLTLLKTTEELPSITNNFTPPRQSANIVQNQPGNFNTAAEVNANELMTDKKHHITTGGETNNGSDISNYQMNPKAEQSECPSSYFVVGDRCVHVNAFIEGSWHEGIFYCHNLGAEYVEADSPQFFFELLSLLKNIGEDKRNYWLGARDEVAEGDWRWETGGGVVPMSSPLWALSHIAQDDYSIEPEGGRDENCLRLDHSRFLYLDDDECGNRNSIMCQIPLPPLLLNE